MIDVSGKDKQQIMMLYLLATVTESDKSITSLLAIRQDFQSYLSLSQELFLFSQHPDVMLCGFNLTRSNNEYIIRFLAMILAPVYNNVSNTTHGKYMCVVTITVYTVIILSNIQLMSI